MSTSPSEKEIDEQIFVDSQQQPTFDDTKNDTDITDFTIKKPHDVNKPLLEYKVQQPAKEWEKNGIAYVDIHQNCKEYIKITDEKKDSFRTLLNEPFSVETPTMKGTIIARSLGFDNTDKNYFKGKNRKSSITCQFRVKRRLRFDRLYAGQIFDTQFTKLPAQFLIASGLKVVKTLAPAMIGDIYSDTPHLMSPQMSACQHLRVDKEGDEPDISTCGEVKEDLTLLDPKFKNIAWMQRKKLFNDQNELKKYFLEPHLVYTFENYTHMFNASLYTLHLCGFKVNAYNYVPSPIQCSVIILPTDEERAKFAMIKKQFQARGEAAQRLKCEDVFFDTNDDADTKITWDVAEIDLFSTEYLISLQYWHKKLFEELFVKGGGSGNKEKDESQKQQQQQNGKRRSSFFGKFKKNNQ